jgi:hypothetical protein
MADDERQYRELSLWKVEGQECSDSSGGPVTLFVFTSDSQSLPDPHAAIKGASKGRYSYYLVNKVELVGSFPLGVSSDLSDLAENCHYGCVDQTGLSLDLPFLNSLARHIVDARRDWDESRRLRFAVDGQTCHYGGISVHLDADGDTRVLRFVEDMGGRFRQRLVSARESKGNLELEWRGAPPKGYRQGDQVGVEGDCWTIISSKDVSE